MTANKPLSPSSINVHDVPYNILKFHFHNFDHCFPEFVFILKYQRPYMTSIVAKIRARELGKNQTTSNFLVWFLNNITVSGTDLYKE